MTMATRSLVTTVLAGLLVTLPPGAAGAQGRGQGHGAGPSPSVPAQGNKPAVPPGQAKQPSSPAVNGPQPKPATPIVVKPNLAANLRPLLPGADLNAAASGFKNLGQFVAAVHVSHNLDIPFTALKIQMVDHQQSLGRAIQTLKPAVSASVEANRAETQARADIAKHGK